MVGCQTVSTTKWKKAFEGTGLLIVVLIWVQHLVLIYYENLRWRKSWQLGLRK